MLYRIQFKLAETPISSEMVVESSSERLLKLWCESVIRDLDEVPDSYEIRSFTPYNVDQEVQAANMWMDLGENGG